MFAPPVAKSTAHAAGGPANERTFPRSPHAAGVRQPALSAAWELSAIAIVPPLQAKLTIGAVDDPLEREADAVADRVMRSLQPAPIGGGPAAVQRKCACDGADEHVPGAQVVEGGDDEHEPTGEQTMVRRKAAVTAPPSAAGSPGSVADRLFQRRDGGEPLQPETRKGMEAAFGSDFSHVRVHRDAEAGAMTRHVGALAFTHGAHIYFDGGTFDPGGSSGARLLAHELAHVVQQGGGSVPTIQRAADWTAGSVHEANNLAAVFVNGTPVGRTIPMLNGSLMTWTTANARSLFVKPTLSFASSATGGVVARVATVPTNTGSIDETVLAPGPWSLTAPKATVGARFSSLAACTGAGNSIFTAHGLPTDAAMAAANRRHENHHAADDEAAFRATVMPWDVRLTAAATAQTTFNGAAEADAEAALYAAIGGTPDATADAYINSCIAKDTVFHATPAGGAVSVSNPTADATCATSGADGTNPS